jgi:hypothetical protein
MDNREPLTVDHDIWSYGVMIDRLMETFYEQIGVYGRKALEDQPELLTYNGTDVEKYYPYKKVLRNCVNLCCEEVPKDKPTAGDIYKLTEAQWDIQKRLLEDDVIQAQRERLPSFRGMGVRGKPLQERFVTDTEFQVSVKDHDWNRAKMGTMRD